MRSIVVAIWFSASVASAAPTGISTSFEPGPVFLTSAQRKARAELIRDTAAQSGMTNAALLAGIGEIETNFAHCWSEATWACKGPNSASCGGGPVIAGASDGACSLQQGGLGMFQFDSGTFSQTIATYGPNIVTLQGNVDAVIPFLVTRAIQSVDGIDTAAEALAWMNSITIKDGNAEYEKWLYFVAWRYNGCKGCTSQINKYRSGTNKLRDEFGPDFWKVTPADMTCEPIPADGRTIDEKDGCFTKQGTATSWYLGDHGMAGACLYTYTTDDPEPDNHATWKLAFAEPGKYRVEVYTDGGTLAQSHQAGYVVKHAGGTSVVVIDQAAHEGFRVLGDFTFDADGGSIELADNTGEPYDANAKIAIAFDAVRVVPADKPPGEDVVDEPPPGVQDDGGGCSTGRNRSGWLAICLAMMLGVMRRGRVRLRG